MFGGTAATAQGPRAERPTYKVGDRWLRTGRAYDLVKIEKDVYVFRTAPGREIHLTGNLSGLFIFLTVMAYNLVGDGLRDAFDPRRVIQS